MFIDSSVQSKKVSGSMFMTWILASLFFAYQYSLRILPSTLSMDIMSRFNMNAYEFGEFNGFYYIAYVVVHIPVGVLMDRLGVRLVLSSCILLTAISQLTLVLSDNFLVAVLGRILTGAASSAAIISVIKAITLAWDNSKFSLILGFSITMGVCGSIAATLFLYPLYVMLGLENMIFVISAVGCVIGLAVAFVAPGRGIPADNAQSNHWVQDVSMLFKADKLWIIVAVLGGMMVGVVEGFADAWSVVFLKQAYSLEAREAVNFSSIMFFAFAVAGPLIGYIDKKMSGKQLITLAILGIISAASFVAILFPLDSTNTMCLAVMLAVSGLCFPFQSLVLSQVISRLPTSISALAAASANMVMMGFGPLYHISIGGFVDYYCNSGCKAGIDGALIYPDGVLAKSLSVIPVGIVLAVLCFFILSFYIAHTERKG